jgi:hypothetical protein
VWTSEQLVCCHWGLLSCHASTYTWPPGASAPMNTSSHRCRVVQSACQNVGQRADCREPHQPAQILPHGRGWLHFWKDGTCSHLCVSDVQRSLSPARRCGSALDAVALAHAQAARACSHHRQRVRTPLPIEPIAAVPVSEEYIREWILYMLVNSIPLLYWRRACAPD